MELERLFSFLFTTDKGKWLGLTAILLMVLLIIFSLAQAINAIYTDFFSALPQKPIFSRDAVAGMSNDLILQLPEQHLFGKNSTAVDAAMLPITTTALHLTGIIQREPINESQVIIAEESQPGKIYQVGDVLPSGLKVYAIVVDGVILENAGQLEKLPLVRSRLP